MSENNQTSYSKYVSGFRKLLQLFYGTKDLDSAYRRQMEYKLQGYSEAGILSGIIMQDQLQNIIDDEHLKCFGMTRQERREKLKLKSNGPEIDWSIYDTPAVNRRTRGNNGETS